MSVYESENGWKESGDQDWYSGDKKHDEKYFDEEVSFTGYDSSLNVETYINGEKDQSYQGIIKQIVTTDTDPNQGKYIITFRATTTQFTEPEEDGDLDGDRIENSNDEDWDGDGISNIEEFHMSSIYSCFDLYSYEIGMANPIRKDIFLEIDRMEDVQEPLEDIIRAATKLSENEIQLHVFMSDTGIEYPKNKFDAESVYEERTHTRNVFTYCLLTGDIHNQYNTFESVAPEDINSHAFLLPTSLKDLDLFLYRYAIFHSPHYYDDDEDEPDHDGDGLFDTIERMYHTDPYCSDSDSDHFNDYFECRNINFDPSQWDDWDEYWEPLLNVLDECSARDQGKSYTLIGLFELYGTFFNYNRMKDYAGTLAKGHLEEFTQAFAQLQYDYFEGFASFSFKQDDAQAMVGDVKKIFKVTLDSFTLCNKGRELIEFGIMWDNLKYYRPYGATGMVGECTDDEQDGNEGTLVSHFDNVETILESIITNINDRQLSDIQVNIESLLSEIVGDLCYPDDTVESNSHQYLPIWPKKNYGATKDMIIHSGTDPTIQTDNLIPTNGISKFIVELIEFMQEVNVKYIENNEHIKLYNIDSGFTAGEVGQEWYARAWSTIGYLMKIRELFLPLIICFPQDNTDGD